LSILRLHVRRVYWPALREKLKSWLLILCIPFAVVFVIAILRAEFPVGCERRCEPNGGLRREEKLWTIGGPDRHRCHCNDGVTHHVDFTTIMYEVLLFKSGFFDFD
jgi:hypothetical protein